MKYQVISTLNQLGKFPSVKHSTNALKNVLKEPPKKSSEKLAKICSKIPGTMILLELSTTINTFFIYLLKTIQNKRL